MSAGPEPATERGPSAEQGPSGAGARPTAAGAVRAPTGAELAWYQVARAVVCVPCWLMWRPKVVGRENLPQTTPYVLAPTHRSYIDTFLAGFITRRRLRFMGKSDVFAKPLAAKLFISLGGFPVRRGTADREAMQICERALALGEPVVLYPEGTRRSGPTIDELFGGPAFVALRANVPIVPVGIGGSALAMPPGAKYLRPAKTAIVIGKPIWPPPAPGTGRVTRRAVDELTGRLRAELQDAFDRAEALARASGPVAP